MDAFSFTVLFRLNLPSSSRLWMKPLSLVLSDVIVILTFAVVMIMSEPVDVRIPAEQDPPIGGAATSITDAEAEKSSINANAAETTTFLGGLLA